VKKDAVQHPDFKALHGSYCLDAAPIAEIIRTYRVNYTKPPLLIDVAEGFGFSLRLAVCVGKTK
jgi:hypothetical protein